MTDIIKALDEYTIAIVIAGAIIVGMTLKTITTIITGMSRERSRREIAAYIAEGSMTPEQGEKLMKADVDQERQA